jgi:hypothetical protein
MKDKHTSNSASSTALLARWLVLGAIAVAGLSSGRASEARFSPQAVAAMSPAAEVVQPFEAMRLGKKYVAEHAGTDFLVGSGNSMLPLYTDHTVVVTKQVGVSDLKAGMTAVYMNDAGRLVAHVLVKKTWTGWVAMGVGNAKSDDTRVTGDNLVGIVVKAYQPSSSPMLALLSESTSGSSVASNP